MNFEKSEAQPPLTGGAAKVAEYAARIAGGEDVASIVGGLPPGMRAAVEAAAAPGSDSEEGEEGSFGVPLVGIPKQYEGMPAELVEEMWTIPVYVDPAKNAEQRQWKESAIAELRAREDRRRNDGARADELRRELGIAGNPVAPTPEASSIDRDGAVAAMLAPFLVGKKEATRKLMEGLYADIGNPASRANLMEGLCKYVYDSYRIADYPALPDEAAIYEKYRNEKRVGVREEGGWMYRGIFPEKGKGTATRGSLNVTVTPEVIDGLDQMILDGKIKANYKFGEPDRQTSPSSRHDSISIYFLEQPSEAVLHEIAALTKPYIRGDNLLGKKVEDGLYLSEIGSVHSHHVYELVEQAKQVDSALSEAIRVYATPNPTQGKTLKLSEAQYYAVRKVARVFGFDLTYDQATGFKIE